MYFLEHGDNGCWHKNPGVVAGPFPRLLVLLRGDTSVQTAFYLTALPPKRMRLAPGFPVGKATLGAENRDRLLCPARYLLASYTYFIPVAIRAVR